MNLHSLSFTHANTYIFAHCKKPLQHGWMFGLSRTSVGSNLQLMLLLQRIILLSVVSFCNRKTGAHWSCGPERSGTSGRQASVQLGCCIFKYVYLQWVLSPIPCMHTHTPYPHPVSFLTFPCIWFQGFRAALIILGGTASIKQNKPVEGLKGTVQLLMWNTGHFCRIIPTDTTGAAVWTIGMRLLCLTEKVIQALTIRIFFPQRMQRDCIKLFLNYV